MSRVVVGMVGGSSVGVSSGVGGGGWWMILCWVSSCREQKKRVGAVGQSCWVQEYMPTVLQIDWSARW
jgi:hypothetical protein